jgi:hypothetical protein
LITGGAWTWNDAWIHGCGCDDGLHQGIAVDRHSDDGQIYGDGKKICDVCRRLKIED